MESTRHAAVAQLIALASSADYRDRAAAGRALAVFADVWQAREPLLALVLDTADTFVTRVTAEALLRRQDLAGYTVVARALTVADDNHADWIYTAIIDVFVVYGDERDAAVGECEALLDDEDDQVRRGARLLRRALTALTPVLLPPRPAADQP
ncbi:hypothetical protein GPZ80_14415 [Actinokineospora sp. HBU206404]|uniref:HEAT repeat domain-containing protein n=2 Tax=Actinokineospora xionganensis TaxID=2684470 RepID=A0ABR7L6P0_9PSEU|nr:hypothetical protein [Actinokineospora xionganensis]